ncbi:lipid-binding start [Chrysochromulina tobinii]|uniref:Lipid-binding start n=1 Tax=Chrysochromulina tobinii TaxID=1460289 RepID=A0A0M0JXL0_9EUKA|nr:lipid-binding start [Chrysochromulina tobinii]|eukprot:KOO31304.1 lipid-binding start [Chrysochromulina sp. CCMP291]
MRTSSTLTFDRHISEFMSLFLDPTLNREWNQRMSSQHVVQDALHGEIVHQTYGLPWPLKSRELLMRCTNDVARGTQSVTARCASVHTDRVPISSERVRMEIIGSMWKFDSLPLERTRITVELAISENFTVGVPSFIVDYVQKHSLTESMRNFERATTRLHLARRAQNGAR